MLNKLLCSSFILFITFLSFFTDPTCGYKTWRNVGRFGSFDTHIQPGTCKWAIQGPRMYLAIQVFVTKMNVTQSENCELEYIKVKDHVH